METNEYVFFYGHQPNSLGVHIFSQWYSCSFVEKDGTTVHAYTSAEQYMMAQKALLFNDTYYYHKIMSESDPGTIKRLGQRVRNFDPHLWNLHKFEIVVQGNRLKFEQNPEHMKRLLQTGSKKLVEASPYDKVWGSV